MTSQRTTTLVHTLVAAALDRQPSTHDELVHLFAAGVGASTARIDAADGMVDHGRAESIYQLDCTPPATLVVRFRHRRNVRGRRPIVPAVVLAVLARTLEVTELRSPAADATERPHPLRAAVRGLQGTLRHEPDVAAATMALVGPFLDGLDAAAMSLATRTRGLPDALVAGGLLAAFDAELGETSPMIVAADSRVRARRYPFEVEAGVYDACREAVANATRHAPGARIGVNLQHTIRGLRFSVNDDGPGFDAHHLTAVSTLNVLGDRVAAMGGRLTLDTVPGSGTVVSGFVPI